MFSKSALLTAVMTALAVSATPALEVKLSGPNKVTDMKNLKVVTTVTNTGDESMKLLNDPRSVLNTFPAESFTVKHEASGASPKFVGARLKYVPTVAIKMNNPESFTTLKPGQSVDVTHDLSSAYDFSKIGTGKYTFIPSNSFYYVDPKTSKPVAIYARSADMHQLDINGSLTPSSAQSSSKMSKRATFNGCSDEEQSQLNDIIATAQNYAQETSEYTDEQVEATPRFTTWFGSYTDSSYSKISTAFDKINGNDFSSFTYDCSCKIPDTFAYVYPDTFGEIFLCGAFWNAPLNGSDSQGGTLVHEASHFTQNGGTDDIAYGEEDCMELAKQEPGAAIRNADSYEYYTENNPVLG